MPGDLLEALLLLVDEPGGLGLRLLHLALLVGERRAPCGRTPPRAAPARRACGRGSPPSATTRFSSAAISWRRAWIVLSNSALAARTFSLASMAASRSLRLRRLRGVGADAARPRCRAPPAPRRDFRRAMTNAIAPKTAATARPAAMAIARDVLMSAPLCPGDAEDRGGYTMRRKSLPDEGSILPAPGNPIRPIASIRAPFGVADASPSGAQGVVQFPNQAFRPRQRVRRIVHPVFPHPL